MAFSIKKSDSRKRDIAPDDGADEATRSRRRRMLATSEQKAADCQRTRLQRSAETCEQAKERLAKDLRRRRNKSVAFEAAVMDIDDLSNASVEEYNCGTMSLKCRHCDAAFYIDERLSKSTRINPAFGLCCGDGKVKLWTIPDPPEPLATLLTDGSTRCRQFRRDIRKYNCALCLASLRANEVTFPSGPSVFKVQGEVYRLIGPMHEADGQEPKCLQTFFVDAAMQADYGKQRFGAVDATTMTDLRHMLESCNSYVRSFVTIDEQLQSGCLLYTSPSPRD